MDQNQVNQILSFYVLGWKRAFDFEGLSNRREYWWFSKGGLIPLLILQIFQVLAINIALVIDKQDPLLSSFLAVVLQSLNLLESLAWLAFLYANLPLIVRRLRDIRKPWPWVFIFLIPFVSFVMELAWFTRPSKSVYSKENFISEPRGKTRLEESDLTSKTIENKLVEVKSLFERKLIDEDEYNSLRKDILGL